MRKENITKERREHVVDFKDLENKKHSLIINYYDENDEDNEDTDWPGCSFFEINVDDQFKVYVSNIDSDINSIVDSLIDSYINKKDFIIENNFYNCYSSEIYNFKYFKEYVFTTLTETDDFEKSITIIDLTKEARDSVIKFIKLE